MPDVRPLKRIGHKGADLIAPGNTLESFDAALAAGVDMVISVGTSPLFFMNDASSQHYNPHYVLNSDYGPGALLQLAAPKDQLVNAAGAGYAERPQTRPLTKFEQRGIDRGHGVRDLVFTKRA